VETIVVAALNGLVVGASLALVAAGLALLFGVLGVLNFAQGDFFMLGAYVVWLVLGRGQSFWLGVVVAVVVVGLVCGLGLMAMIWPLRDRAHALVLLATLALSLILEQAATSVFGGDSKSVGAPIGGHLTIGHTDYPLYYLLVVLAAVVVLAGGFVFLKYVKYGIWMRAVAQNRRLASVLGVPVSRVYVGLPPRGARYHPERLHRGDRGRPGELSRRRGDRRRPGGRRVAGLALDQGAGGAAAGVRAGDRAAGGSLAARTGPGEALGGS
jgi:branched-subunit amino acid ABC-type transport system permease component